VVQTGSDRRLYFDLTANPKEITSQLFKKLGKAFDIYLFLRQLSSSVTSAERTFQGVDIFVQRGISDEEQQRRRENDRVELPPSLQLLSQFSDGERSFLGRMSLFSMLRDQPSLVMLDEPEVHFNDYWKRQIVLYLHEALHKQQIHALITTHSSIALTDVSKEDILILYREHAYTEKSDYPSINTLAADPSDIMVHVFQAPYATGQHAVNRVQNIEQKINDQRTGRVLPANIENEANNLLNQLGPGYWRYQLRRALYQQPQDVT
jgi:ABC-type multidrug transport system ATPase subunit